jgi:hypothetical protein
MVVAMSCDDLALVRLEGRVHGYEKMTMFFCRDALQKIHPVWENSVSGEAGKTVTWAQTYMCCKNRSV